MQNLATLASNVPEILLRASKLKLGHARFMGSLSPTSYDLIKSTCVQNLTILALAVPEISLGPQNLKWVT